MISAVFAAAAILFMQAAPAATPSPAAAPPAASTVSPVSVTGKKQAAVDKDPNEVICHSEAVIGSLFPKKVCASRREMEERRTNDQKVAADFQRSTIVGTQPH
jgi:hypothetical protein